MDESENESEISDAEKRNIDEKINERNFHYVPFRRPMGETVGKCSFDHTGTNTNIFWRT